MTMALEGQLSDFNLAEILQLLASQQKSGFLNLETNRNMVFIFDKGVLISTRDRRSRSRDPLESFLRAYGFFNEQQWKHIEYVRKNSSLDLTEILISEGLMDNEEMDRALKSLAQEMAHAGMKMRRGRYHFSPTKDTPPGRQVALQPGRAGPADGGRPPAGRRSHAQGVPALPGHHLQAGQQDPRPPTNCPRPAGASWRWPWPACPWAGSSARAGPRASSPATC